MGVKGVTLPLLPVVDTDRSNLLLNLLTDHCYLKLHCEQEENQQLLEVTLNLTASLVHLLGLTQKLNSSTLCSVGQASRLRKNHFYNRAISWYASSA